MLWLIALTAALTGVFPAEENQSLAWSRLAVSPSGKYALEQRRVHGGWELMVRDGPRFRWGRVLPVEVQFARITDEARVVLTGTRAGRLHEAGKRQTYFVLAILDPWGQLLQYQHVTQRRSSGGCGVSPPTPRARYLIVEPGQDVVGVWLEAARLDRGATLWLYRFSTGQYLGDLCPRDVLDVGEEERLHLEDVRFAGRHHVVTVWSRFVCGRDHHSRCGEGLALIRLGTGVASLQRLDELAGGECGRIEATGPERVSVRMFDGRSVALAFSPEPGAVLERREPLLRSRLDAAQASEEDVDVDGRGRR